ncbi:DNA-directed RNA polymerase I subunit RPA12 [Trichogramma pretiosum]|uniref:DNA-directed RNA polymerase I subunit RPA12 n=1 Tax=Trichogramma pretiosum TaxID=7493 RepID=UPI0006C97B90|nr:DNA-directed RNA polymerase I subunit RPA12 [Trichogramma pretiosum]
MSENTSSSFITKPGFCPDCGSVLPLLKTHGGVTCWACKQTWGPEVFGDMKLSYLLEFSDEQTYASASQVKDNGDEAEGPTVDKKCPKCGNDKMSYATLQLRSADEGQTVFYTCTKCKHKESENS